jgi:hypothetical protein
MNESAEYTETIRAEFPILSQTSTHDKRVLLNLREILQVNPSYSYLEIGSYLGGSLTPFLSDPKCTAILSIDDRGRVQPDERGRTFDYSHITHETMISTLEDHGLSVEKLKVFDGSISDYADADAKYDLLFIDGEHTDWACFRDFVYGTDDHPGVSHFNWHEIRIPQGGRFRGLMPPSRTLRIDRRRPIL